MLKIHVKASQVTNLTDARYFSAWEVNWLGFNLELGTENYIAPSNMKEIRGWLEGPKIVGEFGMTETKAIQAAVDFLELDAVQIGHFATVETAKALQEYGVIKEVVINTEDNAEIKRTLEVFTPFVEAFIFDFSKNNIDWQAIKTGKFIDFQELKTYCSTYPVLLNFDVKETDLPELIDALNPLGITVTGGEEEKVGFKSFDEIDDIFEYLRIED